MCLAIPGRIDKIVAQSAIIDFGRLKKEARLDLVPQAKVGDYVLVHAGFVIQIVDEEEMRETMRLLEAAFGGSTIS